ncbi:MAG: hypothetical protein NTY70_09890, partial [Burkholderiales bacterium]|nr:hypothetical protein [Burkholderiales bacterium]
MNAIKASFTVSALALSVAAIYLFSASEALKENAASQLTSSIPSAIPVIAPASTQSTTSVEIEPSKSSQSATKLLGNPLERSSDLRAIYYQFKDSQDPIERHTAYRAWSACFPTFIAAAGQTVTVEEITKNLPANSPNRAARIEAYRNLQGRCLAYSDITREEALKLTAQQLEADNSGRILSPGDTATKQLNEGNQEAALKIVYAILASKDAFAINSLQDFVQQYLVLQVDAQMLNSSERPDLRALAFSLAACELGLECGPGSLS